MDQVGKAEETLGLFGLETVDEEAIFGGDSCQLPDQADEIRAAPLWLAVEMVTIDADAHAVRNFAVRLCGAGAVKAAAVSDADPGSLAAVSRAVGFWRGVELRVVRARPVVESWVVSPLAL